MRRALLLAVVVAGAGLVGPAARSVLAAPLTLERALALAQKHPDRGRARADVDAANAQVDSADSARWPQVSGALSYQRSTANFVARPGAVPSAINRTQTSSFDTQGFLQGSLQASWLVWDFGQIRNRVGALRATAMAQEEAERLLGVQIDAGVRVAFAALQAAVALRNSSEALLRQHQQRERLIAAWVEVGRRPPIDLVQVRADIAQAEVQLTQTDADIELAWVQLTQAVGTPLEPGEVAAEEAPPLADETKSLDALVTLAASQRGELRQLVAQQEAQRLQTTATRRAWWPSLNLSSSLTEAGQTLDAMAWNWSAGLALQWPIWQGGKVQADVRVARAQQRALTAREASVLQQLRVEVQRAEVGVRAARNAVRGSEVAERLARERLTLAEGRYAAGMGTLIDVSDAQAAVQTTEAQKVQARYRLAVARAQLQLALGQP